jgi:hypothetical protein
MSARGFSGKEEEVDLDDAKIAEILAEAEGDSVNSMDTEAYLQEQLDAARIEEAAEIAEMSPEQLFFSRHGIPALTEKVEQDKLDEELEKLAEELKNEQIEQIRNIDASRKSDLAHRIKEMREKKNPSLKKSGIEKNRQAFARQAFKETANDDDEFGGGKKRTIRKKNRKGTRTRTTIRKRQRKNRTRTMRKKARKSRKSNKAR